MKKLAYLQLVSISHEMFIPVWISKRFNLRVRAVIRQIWAKAVYGYKFTVFENYNRTNNHKKEKKTLQVDL